VGPTAERVASAESPVPAAMSRTRIPRATRAARRTNGMKYLVTCAKARSYSAAASRLKTSSSILCLVIRLRMEDLQIPFGDGKSLKPAPIDDWRRGHDEPDAGALWRALRAASQSYCR